MEIKSIKVFSTITPAEIRCLTSLPRRKFHRFEKSPKVQNTVTYASNVRKDEEEKKT